MRVAKMVHGHPFLFLSITMYLWESGACTYASGRTRSFFVCIMLVYAKEFHLHSGPLCHDALHSICHIKIKLHLTYSALSRSKSVHLNLIGPHLISLVFYHSPLDPSPWSCILIHQIIFILHSSIPVSSYSIYHLFVTFHLVQPQSDICLTFFD